MRYLMRESYTVDYAGFWLRIAAFIIDGAILWGLNYALNGIWNIATGVGWSGGTVEQFGETITTTVSHWGMRVLVIFLVQAVYFVIFWGWRGQTPGKMALRIKIARFDGSRIGWSGAFLRYCGYIISTLIIFIGFFWIPFDGRRQGIHDKIAETFVIRVPRKEKAS
jgi:uncharacterized RDD family membrane protein YckC